MRKSTIHSALRILAIVLGITVASQASARYFHNPSASVQYKVVKIETPAMGLSAFETFNTAGAEFGTLRIPMIPAVTKTGLFDGGHDGDRDTSDGNDTNDNGGHGPHDGDTTNNGGGGHDGDTTDMGGGGHDGNNDSTDLGDTSRGGDHGGNGGHDGNDTVDCPHHGGHADNDDSTAVGDSTLHTLFGGGRQSIMVKSHGSQANVAVLFTNNLATSVTITNMSLASGKNFSIISGAPSAMKPIKLPPGQSISLKVAFKATDFALHTDQLQVTTTSSQALSTITLSGVQVAAASVNNSLPSGMTITALPNPMTSRLKIDLSGVSAAAVVIYDINGKQVLSTTINSSEWIWNGTSQDGSMLLSGTYIVRLTGLSTEGAPFVSTQKIILAR